MPTQKKKLLKVLFLIVKMVIMIKIQPVDLLTIPKMKKSLIVKGFVVIVLSVLLLV